MRRTVARGSWAVWALALAALAAGSEGEPGSDWVTVDYGQLVDRRELTHSGEPVEVLLERAGDPRVGALLDPVLERYAFVLPDAFDSVGRFRPRTELAGLWPEGGSEPAWVELLRARRYVVESDGQGALRLFLPAQEGEASAASAEAAWRRAWPVLRHVLAAEGRRRPGPLTAEVYPYVHEPGRTRFRVGLTAFRAEVGDTEAGAAAPLDLDAWRRHLEDGLTLDGARLGEDGRVRLLGERGAGRATLLSRPLALSDLAVAWRAVAHGGLAEPYMSLDRGDHPWTTRVTYGGRLRDTALGLVSLRCDVRFKTFSLGLAEDGRSDLRERLRAAVPGFRTHLERFAADPASGGTWSQQTRLWFYPDQVEMALSSSGDALVLGRARMTAASERQEAGGGGEDDPAWTRDTVLAVNRDYDALAAALPELHDLDQVVRLLSLATWLHQARADSLPVPDLDVLLDVTLPAEPTPRIWPQVLAFNALPPSGGAGEVEVIGRAEVGEALARLQPASGRLPARRRLARALAALDPARPDHALLLREAEGAGERLADGEIDLLAWRAERLGMHALVLGTLPEPRRAALSRERTPRLFSVGIGGLDLGMRRVLARAPRRTLPLRAAPAPPPAGKAIPRVLATPSLPAPADARRHRFQGPMPSHAPQADDPCDGAYEDGARLVRLDASCRPTATIRREGGRRIAFRFEREGTTWSARVLSPAAQPGVLATEPAEVPAGLALLAVVPAGDGPERTVVPLRLQVGERRLEAALPRRGLQRLLLGAALAPAGSPSLPGLVPPPPELAGVSAWMLWTPQLPVEGLPGEEDPVRLADALRAAGLPAVVGVGPHASRRWAQAQRIGRTLLVAPADAFPGAPASLRAQVLGAWGKLPAAETLPRKVPDLIVLASAEAPAMVGARARALAADRRLAGRHLAVLSLGGPLDPALAVELLGAGVAAVAVAGAAPGQEAGALARLRGASAAMTGARREARAETLWGLGTWVYGGDEVSASPAPASPRSPPPSPSRTRSRP